MATPSGQTGDGGSFEALLGPSLVRLSSSRVKRFDTSRTNEVLGTGHVGLLFAADWSEESRAFVASLAGVHRALEAAGTHLDLVLVSSDRSVDAFAKTLATGPATLLALPYAQSLKDRESSLARQFGVDGPPALVVLDKDARLINRDALDAVQSPDALARFPWPPPSLGELLSDLTDDLGSRCTLRGGHVCLLFATPSSAACRAFAPLLADAARRSRTEGAVLELLFVPGSDSSSENSAQALRSLLRDSGAEASPWLSLPDGEAGARRARALRAHFSVDPRALPRLVVLDGSLQLLNPDAVRRLANGGRFPWAPTLVCEADSKSTWDADPGAENTATLVLLAERAGGCWASAEAVLGRLAREAAAKEASADGSNAKPQRFVFMLAREQHGLGLAVRKLARLPPAGPAPAAVLLDLSDNGSVYVLQAAGSGSTVDEPALRSFLAAFRGKALTRTAASAVHLWPVAAALHNPSLTEMLGGEDIHPAVACVQCLLCPITCPIVTLFQCCAGCCLLAFVGGALGASAIAGGGARRGQYEP